MELLYWCFQLIWTFRTRSLFSYKNLYKNNRGTHSRIYMKILRAPFEIAISLCFPPSLHALLASVLRFNIDRQSPVLSATSALYLRVFAKRRGIRRAELGDNGYRAPEEITNSAVLENLWKRCCFPLLSAFLYDGPEVSSGDPFTTAAHISHHSDGSKCKFIARLLSQART